MMGRDDGGDSCTWYFMMLLLVRCLLNDPAVPLAVVSLPVRRHSHTTCPSHDPPQDCSIGLVSVYFMLLAVNALVARWKWTSLYSGEYGSPPSWRRFWAQAAVYSFVMVIEKVLVSLLLLIPAFQDLGNTLLQPLAKVSQTLELVVALMIMFVPTPSLLYLIALFVERAKI